MNDHLYVYCAVEGPPPMLPAAGMPGGGPPRAVSPDGDVSLIVSTVPASTYNSDTLESRLQDLDWVSVAGAAHHAVVDALADAGATVLPFRLFTVFSREEAAVAMLRRTREAMRRAFDRLRGRQEWVLRIGKPDPARIRSQPVATPVTGSGTSFLQAKAGARREASARAKRVQADAKAAYDQLARLADTATTRAVDPSGRVLLDAAFLVRPDNVAAMREALTRSAERLLADGCPVSLTGPWPPYSFASMDGFASEEPPDV